MSGLPPMHSTLRRKPGDSRRLLRRLPSWQVPPNGPVDWQSKGRSHPWLLMGWVGWGIALLVFLSGTLEVWGAAPPMVTVSGRVVAVNSTDSPGIVVVEVITRQGQVKIVGALVDKKTEIRRKGRSATLTDIREGEPIEVTYIGSRDGALARRITLP